MVALSAMSCTVEGLREAGSEAATLAQQQGPHHWEIWLKQGNRPADWKPVALPRRTYERMQHSSQTVPREGSFM